MPLDEKKSEEWIASTERATLITVGATVTIVAGFLSQVWGSGSHEFRHDVAKILVMLGGIFFLTVLLPVLSFLYNAYKDDGSRKPAIAVYSWLSVHIIIIALFCFSTSRLAYVILKHAAAP